MINIAAVGSLKEDYLKSGVADYLKRISHYDKVVVTQVARANPSLSDERIIETETESLLKAVKNSDYIILCDLSGESVTSVKLAQILNEAYLRGKSNIAFIIGGSIGVADRLRNISDKRICFSSLTFPHGLFRLLLTEQIYRSFKIINKETYHK